MGNGKSHHRLYCEGCDKNYYDIGSSTWYTSGTVDRHVGYCPSCCGGTTKSWTWTGNVVRLKCKNCSGTFNIITWSDWKNRSYETTGFCDSCYEDRRERDDEKTISSISSIFSAFGNLSLDVMPEVPEIYANIFTSIAYTTDNHLTTPFYEHQLREDHTDAITFSLERKYTSLYTMKSPNSIQLDFTDGHENKSITIVFGTKGSNVHVAVSLDTYKNSKGYRSVYHFGLLLSGNTYTVKDNKKGTKSVKHYMMVHLMEDDIVFMLCKTRERAMKELNRVWCGNAKHGKISHYHKIVGHSVLSAQIICKFLVKEQDQSKIPYDFKGLKDHHEHLAIWYPKHDLAVITNCFLFVIRFLKLLNKAHTKKIEIPDAKDIVDWTIGKQDWYNCDIFDHVWDHGKYFAEPL